MTDLTPEQSKNIAALGLKLTGLGINARFTRIETGPVVTGYFFTLAASESIKKVMNKSEDFALALAADKVIVTRVAGEIVIFIPNKERQFIDYKEILHWYLHDENVDKMSIPIPLGVDFHGTKSAFDLTDMPHCLITGSTGSGKSVFEAGIITSLSYKFDPSELHMYLVDTKKVDLPLFKGLPHVKQVADNINDFHNMFTFIMMETRKRLSILQGASCRKAADYHKLQGTVAAMPWLVVMIDEFGDLMDLDKSLDRNKDGEYEGTPTVKSWVKQAGQICRAAGVHLICCTQRASVKIVDGDIKANLPCRIALRLPTAIDSRTILGTSGAENLLGKGDMLVQSTDQDVVKRYHGPYVRSEDIAELVFNYDQIRNYIKA